jgi:hypothetical protein
MATTHLHPYVTPWKNHWYKPLALKPGWHYTETINQAAGGDASILDGLTIFVNDTYIIETKNRTMRVIFDDDAIKRIYKPSKWAGVGVDSGYETITEPMSIVSTNNTTQALQTPARPDAGQWINRLGAPCSVVSLAPGVHFGLNSLLPAYNDDDYYHIEIDDKQASRIKQDLEKNKIIGGQSMWFRYPSLGERYVYTNNLPDLRGANPNITLCINASRTIPHLVTSIAPAILSGLTINAQLSDTGIAGPGGEWANSQYIMTIDRDYSTSYEANNHGDIFHMSKYNDEIVNKARFHRLRIEAPTLTNSGSIAPGNFLQLVMINNIN